jgi:hypothetical protein
MILQYNITLDMITKKYKLLIIPNALYLMGMTNNYDAFNSAQCHVDDSLWSNTTIS